MTASTFGLIILLLLVGSAVVLGWIRWRRWRGDEQDTRLLTGIVDLRQRFRNGELEERLPAKGRGFTRDVETAVNRLLDETAVHLRARQDEAVALAKSLDLLGGVVTRTVAQLETTAREIEGLGNELGRMASSTGGTSPFWNAVERLGTAKEHATGHWKTAITLAEHSQAAAGECDAALVQLRATLADLTGELTGTGEEVRTLREQWTEVGAGVDQLADTAATAEVLAVNVALAARRQGNGALERLVEGTDELAHEAAGAVARVGVLASDCGERLARLAGSDAEARVGRAAAGAAALDGALRHIRELPSGLTALASALSAAARLQTEAAAHLSTARPDALRRGDDLQAWTTHARRLGSVLADAAGVLTGARREAERLLGREVSV